MTADSGQERGRRALSFVDWGDRDLSSRPIGAQNRRLGTTAARRSCGFSGYQDPCRPVGQPAGGCNQCRAAEQGVVRRLASKCVCHSAISGLCSLGEHYRFSNAAVFAIVPRSRVFQQRPIPGTPCAQKEENRDALLSLSSHAFPLLSVLFHPSQRQRSTSQ